jgi:hypothetical protein
MQISPSWLRRVQPRSAIPDLRSECSSWNDFLCKAGYHIKYKGIGKGQAIGMHKIVMAKVFAFVVSRFYTSLIL